MPALSAHKSASIVKLLLIGDSGAGKTGSLTSLVKAGYKLRVLDFDNGLDPLATYSKRQAPDKLANVEFRTLRDKRKGSQMGAILDGIPSAFADALKMLDKWEYTHDGTAVSLGSPATWGPDCVLVIDSLTMMARAAYNWQDALNPAAKDKRQIFYAAQQAIENTIALLTSESFNTNVIVIAHIDYQTRDDGTMKGFPTAVGSALGPKIPAYFNSMAMLKTSGTGQTLKREVHTLSTAMIDLKNPASFTMPSALPIDTALADFFQKVKG